MTNPTAFDVVPDTVLALLPADSPRVDSTFAEHVRRLPAFRVPWDQLAETAGWVLWLGQPPASADLPLPPIREELLFDDPSRTVAAAAAISLTYAHRRGATNHVEARRILHREAPVAVVVPNPVPGSLVASISALQELGVPLLEASDAIATRFQQNAAFQARAIAHSVDLGMRHDPVFSFLPKQFASTHTIGDNALSSFILHAEGERDAVSIIGDSSDRVAIEIGVAAPGIGIAETAAIERDAAAIPNFLEFATAQLVGHRLEISWDLAHPIPPTTLAELFRVWLKALWQIPLVDVRLAFAPSHGRSALLVDMRARAQQYRALRDDLLRDQRA